MLSHNWNHNTLYLSEVGELQTKTETVNVIPDYIINPISANSSINLMSVVFSLESNPVKQIFNIIIL